MTSKEELKNKNLELAKELGIDLSPQPTPLEKCIKEWEDRGFNVIVEKYRIKLLKQIDEEYLYKRTKCIKIYIYQKYYSCDAWLSFEEHYLLTKTH